MGAKGGRENGPTSSGNANAPGEQQDHTQPVAELSASQWEARSVSQIVWLYLSALCCG